ncbi:amino acid/amide ABC transporter substrate-binding protein, HAAT family [Salegentibacter agarivorans]|jgi:LysM repeat protein|uniref:Amino acid/amide ABC transporter substrate-binding protein, HAAT family n=1 Tax=Salegentibacter agarivorans TaxID=345907 RepID=A0A1I2PE79_9FLAO|nr:MULTISPECIES: LysM peptidoglycan-binding domain-containing protein [Salegentibacter]APS40186.1 peptidoglycan-binding protein LysM [Salegentibacter sp. T436]SFG14445.1 amino acid/amide ABC transporter substrate-binding protein, HAAT family [Salegentibacter agarivorans]
MKYLLIVCFLFQLSTLSASAQEFKYHTVEAGETVYSIAKAYNISEEAIYKYNPDAKGNLEVSSKLVIPLSQQEKEVSAETEDIQFITHTVKRKETLYRLSKDYNVEIDEIKRFNKHLYSEELQRGEEILIPQRKKGTTNTEIASSKDLDIPAANKPQISETREHVVLPKETKYGIARKYGLTVKELEELNPKVDVLQPGVMIRVGTDVLNEPVILTDEVFEFYEVKPKETLFGLSRKFDVPQDSLISLNPALEDGLKIGMVLKVPNTGAGEGNLEEGETEELASDTEGTDAGERLDLTNKLSNFDTKQLVVFLPYNLNQIDQDSIANYKDAILEDRVLRISLDFYSGVLMAVEEAKSLGISTQLKTFDTRRSVQEVTNIINSNNFSNVDAVIGPLLQNTIEATASKLTQYNVPVISPLSNREMRSYPNLFQSRPTDEILKNAMFDYLQKNSGGKNIVIIADGAKNQVKNELTQVLPNSRVILPSANYLSAEKIQAQLSETQENWVILESSNVGLLSSATSALNRLARNHQIKLFTTEKNSGYEDDNVDNEHLGRLNFHYPSVDKEFDTTSSEEFIEAYKEEFDMIPNQYVIRGYDLTMDVLLRLASAEDLYDSFEKYTGFTEYHENKFHYTSKRNGGFFNDAVYIMSLDEELNLKVVNDQQSNLYREFKD